MRLRRAVVVAGTVVAATAAGLLALAAPASAHVTVNSPGATQGGYAVITFRVPTESDTASTTALKVQLPTDTPFASVAVQPHPGWTFTTKTIKLASPIKTDDGDEISQAVSEIDWTATSAATAIKPGEFDQFDVSVGPLPKAESVSFKAIQVYSDGSVVNWTDVPAPGSTVEPDHPAPTLQLAAAAPSGGASGSAAPAASGKSSSNAGPWALAGVALGVALIALAYTAYATRRRGAR
ncbi:MAG TPA: YcnI family protein [Jatrophihabitantaceae bacterium]